MSENAIADHERLAQTQTGAEKKQPYYLTGCDTWEQKVTIEEVPFWLAEYSKEDLWTQSISDEATDNVISRTPNAEIEAIGKELHTKGRSIDAVALTNLLRHWLRLSLDERSNENDNSHAKNARSDARKLGDALSVIEYLTPTGHRSRLAYPLSQHLYGKLPVHRADFLLHSLGDIARELRPAAERVAATKLPRGPQRDERAIAEIDGLADIFEHLTKQKATRTYDPIGDCEVGLFRGFVERCMRMLNDGEDASLDWAIRKALEDRAERHRNDK